MALKVRRTWVSLHSSVGRVRIDTKLQPSCSRRVVNRNPLFIANDMGATSSLFARLFGKEQIQILMIGMDGAGKTTILNKLQVGEVITTSPLVGFNVKTVEYKNICLTVWDSGGQERIKKIWRHHFNNAKGIIFVIDCTDRERMQEAQEDLHRIVQNENMRDSVLLVLCNKQDLPDAMNTEEVLDSLKLKEHNNWHVQGTCAATGDGLHEGLEWISNELSNRFN